jgi:hypothetical protein
VSADESGGRPFVWLGVGVTGLYIPPLENEYRPMNTAAAAMSPNEATMVGSTLARQPAQPTSRGPRPRVENCSQGRRRVNASVRRRTGGD